MVTKAIADLKQRNGSSRQAIKKYIAANYNVGDNFDAIFKTQIRNLKAKGVVIQPKEGPNSAYKISPEYKQKLKAKASKPKTIVFPFVPVRNNWQKPPAAKPKKAPAKKKTAPVKKKAASSMKKAQKKAPAKKKPAAKKTTKK